MTEALSGLLLIPTDGERETLLRHLGEAPSSWAVSTVGFGVSAAGVGAADAIARHRPSRVVLSGIAGLFPSHATRFRVGQAVSFDSVTIDGIGVGQGAAYVSAAQLGWPVPDVMSLPSSADNAGLLLTVCAASANRDEADARSERFPLAVAEEMEGYSVALACLRAGIPLTIIRGFSNLVGDRDHASWRTEEALANAASCLRPVLNQAE